MTIKNSYRVELHCHTHYSHDGHILFEGMVASAARCGLDAIAITDHDGVHGALEFRAQAQKDGWPLQVIVGEERTLAGGVHLIGLFLREPLCSTTATECLREIREQGGICVVPHPYRSKDGLHARFPGIDLFGACFEVFNPKCSYEENRKAASWLRPGTVAVGGSDAHYESDLAQSVIVVPRAGDVEDSVRTALSGKTAVEVRGIAQRPGEAGRQYAPLYYQIKPYVRVPRVVLPLAKKVYRQCRNMLAIRPPTLEQKIVQRFRPADVISDIGESL